MEQTAHQLLHQTASKQHSAIRSKQDDAGSGTGKVHINFDGTLRELEAISDEEIKTDSMIEVCDILDNSILVVKKIN